MHTHSTELWASHLALESSLCRPVDVEPALSLSVWMTEHLPSRYPNCCACRTCVAAPPSIDAPQLLLLLHVLCLTSVTFCAGKFHQRQFPSCMAAQACLLTDGCTWCSPASSVKFYWQSRCICCFAPCCSCRFCSSAGSLWSKWCHCHSHSDRHVPRVRRGHGG